ncbi:FkbM family methyltransferase, partial [Patescibacteria group bacterium]|nr:FkbM family methyltransferase [Patescibacteria group bacterium]
IKIDVEGSEMMVLQGAEEILKANKNIVLLVDIHPRMGVIAEEVCEFLISLGFSIFQEKEPFNIPVKDYSAGLFTIIAKRV